MTATINEVAEKCGFDPSTVQQVLNAGIGNIPMQTIQKIMEAADEAGYTGKPHNLGIVYAEESGRGLSHPFFVLVLDAFKQEAEAHGYDITFINHKVIGECLSFADRCRSSHLDGVCLVCADFESQEIKDLVGSGIPCVTVDHIFRRVPAVLSDNETGVQDLVEYAIKRGHRRIAFIHGHNNSVVTRARIKQYRNMMDYYKLPVPPEYMQEGLYDDIELTRTLVTKLLMLSERPTCILLPDDISYLGAQDAARALELSIPGDISFAGYDGIPLSQALTPKLTTICQSTDMLGKESALRLINLIEDPSSANRFPSVYPVKLIEGGTIAQL